MSVKNRWVGPCEQVLNVPITCRRYRPGKPSSSCQQKVVFTPTISMVGSEEKLGIDLRIGQASCHGLCRKPFFSGAVALLSSVNKFTKGCYTRTMRDTYGRGPYMDRACDVLVEFSSAGCTSIQIAMTLEYEYHLFVVVIT
jgi:hypothetical protein